MSAGSVAMGQTGVEGPKATSELRELDILQVKPNHLFWKWSSLFTDNRHPAKSQGVASRAKGIH